MRECGLFIMKFDSRSIAIEILSRAKILYRRTVNISIARLVFERRYFMVLRTFLVSSHHFHVLLRNMKLLKS